jgi:hypothetical protein
VRMSPRGHHLVGPRDEHLGAGDGFEASHEGA